ncbi:hypothetical protein Tco_1334668 [Tanacetum coccineum]
MSASNQQTLADSGANERPSMLERGNYIPWESRFRRFLDNKLEDGERMWNSIQNGMIPNPDDTEKQILEPLSKMTTTNKSQYIADVKVMNYLLQAIPNDIYNSVDACKNAKEMWERIKRLMFGSDVTSHVRHSRLMDEFNNVNQHQVSQLFATRMEQICYHASKAKKAAKNHDPLALLLHSNASLSQSHANSSYSPQPYYVTHPSSAVDYEDEYQGELQGDSQNDKLTTAMMLLARAITQKFSTPTNNRLRTSSNTRDQAVVQDGRVDIQTKNTGYGGNGNRNTGRQNRIQVFNAGNRNDDNNQIVHRGSQTESTLKRQIEQMLLAMKDEAESILKDEENDFLLDNSYGEDTMEELTAAVMLMARIQPANGNIETVPSYDAKAVSELNASSKVYEQARSHVQESDSDSAFTLIKEKPQTWQTKFLRESGRGIIFDDPYVENNGGTSDHDSNAHDEYHEIQMLAYNVQNIKKHVKS